MSRALCRRRRSRRRRARRPALRWPSLLRGWEGQARLPPAHGDALAAQPLGLVGRGLRVEVDECEVGLLRAQRDGERLAETAVSAGDADRPPPRSRCCTRWSPVVTGRQASGPSWVHGCGGFELLVDIDHLPRFAGAVTEVAIVKDQARVSAARKRSATAVSKRAASASRLWAPPRANRPSNTARLIQRRHKPRVPMNCRDRAAREPLGTSRACVGTQERGPDETSRGDCPSSRVTARI